MLKYFIFYEMYQKIIQLKFLKNKIFVGRDIDVQNSKLEKNSRVAERASLRESMIGKYTSIGRGSKINHSVIGSYCAISWDCTIGAIPHPIENLTINAFPYKEKMGFIGNDLELKIEKTIVGNDVWIGANSVIMNGVDSATRFVVKSHDML